MARTHALALLAALLLLPARALAEPAVIAVFEAVARIEPSPSAGALQTFVEGTAVTVSEEARDGWRRVRLGGGGTGWIEERALAFPGKAGATAPGAVPADAAPAATALAAAAPPPSLAAPAPDLHPRIYVKDLDHLAELVKDDPNVAPKARELARKRTTAFTVLGVGLAGGAALTLVGLSQANNHRDLNDPNFGRNDGAGAMTAGLLTSLGAVVVGLALSPSRNDLLDVINEWNVAHPDQPFTIREHGLDR
jgi:SH3 domain-containing protein